MPANYTEESLSKELERYNVPTSLHYAMMSYVLYGRPMGGFLTAVFENKLMEAFSRADLENQFQMYLIVKFIYNELPMVCWGDEEKVEQWHKIGGWIGYMNFHSQKEEN